MADQAEVIRQQMDETRTAMTEKIGALEKQVAETVKDTAAVVAETVHTASDTVDKTVSTIADTVQTVSDTFNVSAHIENHPWLAVGGSVVLGFLIGSVIPRGRRASYVAPAPTPPAPTPPAPTPQPVAHAEPADSGERQSTLASVLGSLKTLAIGTAVGVVGKTLLNVVPTDLRAGLSEMLQDVTESLGGTSPR